MPLPFKTVENSYQAKMLETAYKKWHHYSNIYEQRHTVPITFKEHRYPVFTTDTPAEIINENKSSIKFFVQISEGVRWLDNMPSLDNLDSSCLYVFITADTFSAESYPLYNKSGEQLQYINLYFPWFLYQLTNVSFFNGAYGFSKISSGKFYNFDVNKQIDFVALIGRSETPRFYLTKQIKKAFVKDRYSMSFDGRISGNASIFDKDFKFNRQFPVPFTDRNVFNENITIGQSVPIDVFNCAHINLVAETQIDYDHVDNFFVTEKTTKALFTGIPFIMYGAKNFMGNLRDLGFQTYSSLWSEEYDTLPTYQERADAIVELLKELKTFNWANALPELERIHYQNLKMLANRNSIVNDAFLNLESALENIIQQDISR